MLRRNPDTGKTVAWVAVAGAIGFGAYILLKGKGEVEGIPSGLTITSYQNIRTGEEVSSGLLNVQAGDIVRVYFEYGYFGPALSGTYHVALWQDRPWDPHDEVGPTDKQFDIPETTEKIKIEDNVDMEIKASAGDYGLYMKIMGISGPDIKTSYLASRIRVTGEVPSEEADIADTHIEVQGGEYNIGDTVSFDVTYKYKGVGQQGQLVLSLGTGVVPIFILKHTFTPVPITFKESADWIPDAISGSFTIPGIVEPGQTYSVRATMQALEVSTGDDIDIKYSAFKVAGAVALKTLEIDITPSGGGYVNTNPSSREGRSTWYNGNTGTFLDGTNVQVTAIPNSGYLFEKWSDEIMGGVSYNNPEYVKPMTEHRAVKAHFREEVEPVIDFSFDTPTAYPVSAPPGPVVITCPVKSLSSNVQTAVVKCIVYLGSISPGHGTKLWEDTKTITISPNETQNVQFIRTSEYFSQERRDVGVQVFVGGQLIEEDEWDDIYYVTSLAPTTVSFGARPFGSVPDINVPKAWTCYYFDPGTNDFVGDGNWHNLPDTRQFNDVDPGGFLSAFYIDFDGLISRQYNSVSFDPTDGANYQFELETGRIYQI